MTKLNPRVAKKRVHSGRRLFREPRYVWLFHCSNRLTLHAATLDPRGRNLPKSICQGGTWSVNGQLIVGACSRGSLAVDIEALRSAIELDGFFLWNAEAMPQRDTVR